MADFETKDSGAREQWESGMQRDTEVGKARFDLIIPEGVPYEDQLLTRLAELMGRGAEKYDDRNWEKADSEAEIARAKSSAFRHFMQWFCGKTDEDHAAATIFNLLVVETTRTKLASNMLEADADDDDELPEAFERLLAVQQRIDDIHVQHFAQQEAIKAGFLEAVDAPSDVSVEWGEPAQFQAADLSGYLDTLRDIVAHSIPHRFIAGVNGTEDMDSRIVVNFEPPTITPEQAAESFGPDLLSKRRLNEYHNR